MFRFFLALLACSAPAVVAMQSPPTFLLVTSLKSFDARNISSWSGGGGSPVKITDDSGHPFKGRKHGGAVRSDLKGTRAYGSGYPYGVDNASTIAGRGFPFGTWPIWWGNGSNLLGSDEYGPQLDGIRPGGMQVVQTVTAKREFWSDYTDAEVDRYFIVTDRDTNLAIMTSLVTWCHARPSWAVVYDPATSPVRLENVFQYYRASSFALAYAQYNNAFALNATSTQLTLDQSTPLPDVVQKSAFIKCVQDVIQNALPIVDMVPPDTNLALILGIVFGIFGLPILYGLFVIGIFIISFVKQCFR